MLEKTDLRIALDRAGYYPELVTSVLDVALADESVEAHLVHLETTFDQAEVRRHVTALVLTPTRLVVAHVDDHPANAHHPVPSASASTEAVPISAITSVVLTHVVLDPTRHRNGELPTEVTLAVGWGSVQRVDVGPADCPDPNCDGDHGMTGTLTPDDVVVRVSSAAEGGQAVRAAVSFARALSAATARVRRA